MKFHIINVKLTHSDRKMQLFTFIGKVTRESHKPPEIEKLGVWGFSQDETRRDERRNRQPSFKWFFSGTDFTNFGTFFP